MRISYAAITLKLHASTHSFPPRRAAVLPPRDVDIQRTGGVDRGTWVVVSDTAAQCGRAIAQTSTDDTNYRFPLAVFQKVTAADVQVTIRFKPMTGKVDQAGGIAV